MALFLARRWVAKHGFVPISSPDERGVARRGGQYPAAVPSSMVEPSSLLKWLERSPSMVWLRWERAVSPCCAS
jgi:hypothetical protein